MSVTAFIPNILTAIRVVCAVGLVCVSPFSAGFFALYLAAGISDMIDGPIARRLGAQSSLGSTFDSIADFIFALAVLWVLVPAIDWPLWVIAWVCAIAAVKCITLVVGAIKYHTIPFLHTRSNKLAGLLCFVFPLLYPLVGIEIAAIIPCAVASFAAIEECAITLAGSNKDHDRNVRV